MGGFMKLQRLGGYAAIGTICAYLAAVGVVLSKIGFDISDPAKAMTALLAAPAFSYVLLLLLIASYLLLFIMAFALQEHMQANAPHLTRLMMIAASVAVAMQIAGAIIWVRGIGMIDPQNISVYRALEAITIGLSFAAGHATAWTTLFIGCAILRTRAFSQVLGWLFLVIGILWLPRFIVPQLGDIIDPLSCVAFVWIGIALLKQKQPQSAAKELAASK
jgi:hypothetical protein